MHTHTLQTKIVFVVCLGSHFKNCHVLSDIHSHCFWMLHRRWRLFASISCFRFKTYRHEIAVMFLHVREQEALLIDTPIQSTTTWMYSKCSLPFFLFAFLLLILLSLSFFFISSFILLSSCTITLLLAGSYIQSNFHIRPMWVRVRRGYRRGNTKEYNNNQRHCMRLWFRLFGFVHNFSTSCNTHTHTYTLHIVQQNKLNACNMFYL